MVRKIIRQDKDKNKTFNKKHIMNHSTFLIKPLLITAAMFAFPTVSAQYKVSGRLWESNSETGAASALYHIYAAKDTIHPIVNNITDMDGYFSQELSNPGTYLLKTEYIGTEPTTITFSVSKSVPTCTLGEIPLHSTSERLAEVVVTAKKSLVVSDGANINYNVTEDPSAKTMTILDMLRKVPMVTVDGQDNIRVNGNSDFKIYLNGRPNPMFNNEPQRVLKAMPASSISRIEVLTEPGAKYDAEGSGGILNIVIESGITQEDNGYAGNLEGNISNQQIGASAYIRGKKNNVTASASATYSTSEPFAASSRNITSTEYLDNETEHKLVENAKIAKMNLYHYLGLNMNMSWEPNSNNLFTLFANYNDIKASNDISTINSMFSREQTLVWQLTNIDDATVHFPSLSANVSYQHNFNRPTHSLTTSFQYDFNNQSIDLEKQSLDAINYTLAYTPYSMNKMRTSNNTYTLQIDYNNTLSSKHTIGFGAKGVLTDNNNHSNLSGGEINQIVEEIEDSKMHQYHDIGAIYGTYTGNFGNLNTTAGLRYEYTHLGAKYKTGQATDFSSHLNDLVPNLSVSYSFAPTTVLRAAYNMRITRPSIDQLNPYSWYATVNQIHTGNSDLGSQKSNNISLALSSFKGKFSYNVRLEQTLVDNMIANYKYVKDNITYETYANAGHQRITTLSAFANWQLSSSATISINGTLSYTDVAMKSPKQNNNGWSGNISGNIDYNLPYDIKVNAYGGWGSRNIHLQGWWGGWYYYGISFRRSFLKEKQLTLSINTMNFLQSSTTWKGFTQTNNSNTRTTLTRKAWNVGVSVTWNFGSLKHDVKKTNSIIEKQTPANTTQPNGSIF